ncbi:hypothetical protein B7R76_03570 [Mageeibacillus indolicus]|uniref:Restriction endonuclease n=1 Tax=Mageeibacillus indolicus TaxID=884684 RepID=A0A2J8B5C3_9FIRM|nr:DUF3883 domain-containing protein [Mageeibacillus indolicus]PNH19959.1 hypothetical protein B7R76_03570 [Mageeibacillus indolicus]
MIYEIPSEYEFRIHHCRPRFKGNVENVLIYMATEISKIGDAPREKFNSILNNSIRCFPGNSASTLKTINNWRTEISSLFGLFYEDDCKMNHAMLRAKELAINNDLVQFFKQFIFYFQYPGGHIKADRIQEQIKQGIHFKPAQYLLKLLDQAEKSTNKRCGITKDEACYCIFNDLRCTRDNEDVCTVWNRIEENRKKNIDYDAKGDIVRYAGDILDYMQLANLLTSYNNKEFFLNHNENESILKFINSKEWFDGYDSMIKVKNGTLAEINSHRCDWFEYVNKESKVTDFSTDITAYITTDGTELINEQVQKFKAYFDRLASLEVLKTKDIGDIGESLVHGHECERLKIGGREDLVHLVKKIPTEFGVGYDISSRELDETLRNIEVKTTISSKPIMFNKIHLTPNEWQAAKSYRERYWIYRLMVSKKNIKLFIMCNPVYLFKQDLIDISPRDGMEVTFKEQAGQYEELLAWTN